MAKNNSNKKTYRAKVDLPGGCKKGMIIINGKFVDTNRPCPYDCAKETNFFEEVLPPKYPINSTVILRKQIKCKNCDESGEIKYGKSFTLPAYTEFSIVGEKYINKSLFLIVRFNNNFHLVSEKDAFPTEIYFYVSSKGVVHSSYTGRDEKVEKFRKSVKNFHKTKVDANNYVVKLVGLK